MEIEKPSKRYFIKTGDFSADFNEAYGQLEDWEQWILNNFDFLKKDLSDFWFPDYVKGNSFTPKNIRYILIYVGNKEYINNKKLKEKLSTKNKNQFRIELYDRVIRNSNITMNCAIVSKTNKGLTIKRVPDFWDSKSLFENIEKNSGLIKISHDSKEKLTKDPYYKVWSKT